MVTKTRNISGKSKINGKCLNPDILENYSHRITS